MAGMAHARTLGLRPELWVVILIRPRTSFAEAPQGCRPPRLPVEKDKTDGEIAVDEATRLGAREIVMVGGSVGRPTTLWPSGPDPEIGTQARFAFITSGHEEAYPILNGTHHFDVARGSRFSVIPFTDLAGLDLDGVRWPLTNRSVPLGSSLTVSNVATGARNRAVEPGLCGGARLS